MTPQHSEPTAADAFRTALACLLDLPRDDVPSFPDPDGDDRMDVASVRAWLKGRGLALLHVPMLPVALPAFLAMQDAANPELHWMLTREAAEAGQPGQPVVIYRGGQAVWQPVPAKERGEPVRAGRCWAHFLAAAV